MQPPNQTDTFAQAAGALVGQRPIMSTRLRLLMGRVSAAPANVVEQELRQYLTQRPRDADAIAWLAQTVAHQGRRKEAATLFSKAIEISPDFLAARFNYADLLFTLNRFDLALVEVDRLLVGKPANPLFRQLKAKILDSLGEAAQALGITEQLANENPERTDSWMTYGHALRAAGKQADSIAAYRRAIALNPGSGLAYANLGNLKTFRFGNTDIVAMQYLLKNGRTTSDDRIELQFALAKAYEDNGDYARAFEFYSKGNAAVRLRFNYDPDALTAGVRRTEQTFTHEFFDARAGAGCPAPDPIFIVGRQRSGSTLIEQILASHSSVEGTAELPYIPDIVSEIADIEGPAGGAQYFENLTKLPPEALASLGEQYLARARLHRKTSRPFFTDKNPGNHFHVGLIALILPNAKIIDARRNPAAVCWSQYTHHFTMTNLRLAEFARAWRDYAELMAHFDAVLPHRIHRVIYENLVNDTESEVRYLLEYLGLPFEKNCLRFYETERAVLTPSSEQVRRPITREGLEHWRHFEPWLGPMLKALGPAFTSYPDVKAALRGEDDGRSGEI